MKLDSIPDSLYLVIVICVLAALYAINQDATILRLVELGLAGLLGLSKNRTQTSLVQTGENARVTAPMPSDLKGGS